MTAWASSSKSIRRARSARLETRYVDVIVDTLEEAMTLVEEAKRDGKPLSIGLVANAADVFPELVLRGVMPDVVTDQTPAHDPLYYMPHGMPLEDAVALRSLNPEEFTKRSMESMARHVQAMLDFQKRGSIVFDYGNNLRQRAFDAGVKDAFNYPGFVPAFIRPLFCEGKGPFRWVALSGDEKDLFRTDEAILELFPENKALERWIRMAQKRVAFQGLPARICWLGYGERAKAGLKFNELVANGEVSAPIVIGRDHLDSGSVASPHRETEAMRDGSDAISDWPILNALINAVGGATWVSFHHGGGVGIGYSQHAGQVIVADGTPEAAKRLGARADDRSRHGRRASRRCGLSRSDRVCEGEWDQDSDDEVTEHSTCVERLSSGSMSQASDPLEEKEIMKRCSLLIIVAIALAACAGAAPAPSTSPISPVMTPALSPMATPIAPLEPSGMAPTATSDRVATFPNTIIVYQREGGIAGQAEKWTIYPTGRIVSGDGTEWQVPAEQVAPLFRAG